MDLPSNLTVPINTHKIAHKAPIIERKMNPLFPPVLLPVSETLPAETISFLAFSLTLLKLDIRLKARLTKGVSAAEAGVVGIDSTKAHKAEEILLVTASSFRP